MEHSPSEHAPAAPAEGGRPGAPPASMPADAAGRSPASLPLPPGPGAVLRLVYLLRFGLGGDKDRIIEELIVRYGSVARVHPYVVTWGPDANRLLTTSSRDLLVSWDNPGFPSLASMDGDTHVHHRKVVMKSFHPRRLAGYVAAMRAVLAQHTAAWRDDFDLYAAMSDLALDTLVVTMLGIRPGTPSYDRFVAAYWPLIHRVEPSWLPLVRRVRAARAKRDMWSLLAELVAERRRAPGADALSTIVEASDAGDPVQLSEQELLRYAYMLMDFGQGDIAIYLTYLLAVVATRPELAAAIREESAQCSDDALLALEARLPRTFQLLLEIERVYPPVTDIHRTAVADVAFAGYRIPRGCHLVSAVPLTHRSHALFADPDRFEPARFAPPREEHRQPFALMAFGAGRHGCVATAFCRLHAAVVLHEIVPRFDLRKHGSAILPAIDYRRTLQKPRAPIRLGATPLASLTERHA